MNQNNYILIFIINDSIIPKNHNYGKVTIDMGGNLSASISGAMVNMDIMGIYYINIQKMLLVYFKADNKGREK